jgi:HSP20 family protein
MAETKETPKTSEPSNAEKAQKENVPGVTPTPTEGFGLHPYMQRFAEEMDRLFDEFGMLWPQRRRPSLLSRVFGREPADKPVPHWAPRVEMIEREGQLVVRAELPGMAKNDLKVEVTNDAVTIQGERKEEKKEERRGYYYNECQYGSFFRSIPLPEGADPSKATAEFRNGVLEVVMPGPKQPEKKGRSVEVKGD